MYDIEIGLYVLRDGERRTRIFVVACYFLNTPTHERHYGKRNTVKTMAWVQSSVFRAVNAEMRSWDDRRGREKEKAQQLDPRKIQRF